MTTQSKPRTSTQTNSEATESRLDNFYQSHKDLIGYFGVAIAIIVALLILISMNKQAKEQQASVQFQEAVNAYQSRLNSLSQPQSEQADVPSPVAKDSIAEIQEILDNYPNTSASGNAAFLKAGVHMTEGHYDEALKVYTDWISSHSGHELVPGAMLGKATAEMNLNHFTESLKTLQDIQSQFPNFPLMDVVKFEMGKRFESLENWDSARLNYREIIDRFPDSSWRSLAETNIAEIDRKHPSGADEKPDVEKNG